MIRHRKANPRCVAIFIRLQIHADLIFWNIQKQPGENLMSGDMQTLPVRRVVSVGFMAQRRFGPIRQSLAQVFLGFRAAVLPIEILQPGLQRLFGLPVQRADQHGFPVVPYPWAHA